jgi:hypothetical protein
MQHMPYYYHPAIPYHETIQYYPAIEYTSQSIYPTTFTTIPFYEHPLIFSMFGLATCRQLPKSIDKWIAAFSVIEI